MTPGKKPAAKDSAKRSDKPERRYDKRSAARSVSRKIAMQALYRWQLNSSPWQDLVQEFADDADMPKADREYFGELIAGVGADRDALDEVLAGSTDRPPQELDPVEHAALLIGVWELRSRPDVPYRVAISEAVALTRKFGATDGHKFVNAVLDRLARELRPDEY
jgi:transcription antitermination protein NusB